jgi:hypothetical protein
MYLTNVGTTIKIDIDITGSTPTMKELLIVDGLTLTPNYVIDEFKTLGKMGKTNVIVNGEWSIDGVTIKSDNSEVTDFLKMSMLSENMNNLNAITMEYTDVTDGLTWEAEITIGGLEYDQQAEEVATFTCDLMINADTLKPKA